MSIDKQSTPSTGTVPPDPDPYEITGLEPGGGVSPGSTPPDSAQTSGLGEPEPRPRRRVTPTSVVYIIAIVIFAALFAAAAVAILVDVL